MAFENTFYLTEQTGSLTATITDTSAWGTGTNPVVGDVLSDDIVIALPNSTTFLPDTSNTVSVDLFALGFPAATTVTLTSVDFGQAAVTDMIPDGIYQVERTTVYDSGSGEETVTTTWNAYFIGQLRCCLDNLSNHRGCSCDGNDLTPKEKRIVLFMMDLYSIAGNERNCQDNEAAADAMQDASDLCNNQRCMSCNC